MNIIQNIIQFLKNSLIFIILFSYIYNVRLEVMQYSLSLGVIAIVLTSVISLPFTFKRMHSFINSYIGLFLFILIIGMYSGFIVAIVGIEQEFYFTKMSISNIVYILFSAVITFILLDNEYDIYDLMRYIFYISLVNSLIILVSFFFPEVRLFIESFLYHDPLANIDYLNIDFRLRGLAASGGASLSVFMGLSLAIGAIALEAKRISIISFLISSICILFSIIFVGRTGLILGLWNLLFWFFIQLMNRKLIYIQFLIVILFVSLSLFFIYYDYFSRVINYYINIDRIIDGIKALSGMLTLPNNLSGLLFGFGFFEAKVNYRSDSGYLKTIFSIGIPLSIFLYSIYAYLYLRFIPKNMLYGGLLWFFSVFFFFFLEIKEPFFYQNMSARVLILVSVFVAIKRIIIKDQVNPWRLGITHSKVRLRLIYCKKNCG